jgi:TolA-binding protein
MFGRIGMGIAAAALALVAAGAVCADAPAVGASVGAGASASASTNAGVVASAGAAATAATEPSLFASASAAYPASGLDDLGVPGRGFEAARALLERLLREYPAGERASAAEYRLGLLRMDPANPGADLDAARATFEGLVRRAPRAPEAPAALEAAGLCLRLKGESPAAAAYDVRLLAEHPVDPAAARARLRLALDAARRDDADAPLLLPPEDESGPDGRARARRALLERASSQIEDAGEIDDELASPHVEDPVSIAAAASGAIFILDGDSGRIVSAGDRGAPQAADRPGQAPRRRGVAVDPHGGVWTWDEKGITPPDGVRVEPRGAAGKGEPPQPLKRIVAVAPGLMGTVDVIDASSEQVLRYGPGFVLRGIVPLPARPLAAARDEDGTLDVLVASRPRQVLEIPAGPPVAAGWPVRGGPGPALGWTVSTISLKGPDWELDSPVAVARDDLGRVHVLDDRARSITIFDRLGRRVTTIALPRLGEEELRSPSSLAVDGSGRIYVADRKLGRVVRLR